MKSVVVVRHGERQDYVMRDSGKNWIPTSDRPWDPPLTSRGHEQSKALGYALPKILKDQNLPPIAAIYSSPFLRCRQTSVGLIVGSQTAEKEEEDSELGKNLKVQVELGLTESLNENWYRSWAVPGTDGTWGYQKQEKPLTELDRSTLHPAAKDSVKNVLDWKLATSDDDDNIREYMDFHHVSKSTIDTLYCMDPPKFESFKMQRGRMFNTMELLSDENNDKTIVMVSHGRSCVGIHMLCQYKVEVSIHSPVLSFYSLRL